MIIGKIGYIVNMAIGLKKKQVIIRDKKQY